MPRKKNITHFGVKGMQWGRRKGSSESADSSSAKKIKKSKLKTLSNKKLEALNKRMRLEKDFKKHTKKDYSKAVEIIFNALKIIGSIKVASVVVNNAPNAIRQLTAPAAVIVKTIR